MSSHESDSTDLVVAVDVGNTTVHLGQFGKSDSKATSTLSLSSAKVREGSFDQAFLADWIPSKARHCFIASVYTNADQSLTRWLRENRPALAVRKILSEEFPIVSRANDPTSVGADRIAAAVAANSLRDKKRGAIVVDSGTAITVDAVDANGQFLGGAIAPGWRMSADALHRVADQLPLIEPTEDEPFVIGTNTADAMRSGIYWGTVGLVRELVTQMQSQMACDCDLFVTGGGAEMLAKYLPDSTVHPELVLAGIVLAGRKITSA